MPPKKAITNGETGEAGNVKFTWEGANDYKLLLLIQGRYAKPEEYEQLASAFPGTGKGGIRNRISTLRVKQRDMYKEMGWTLPEGGAGHAASPKPKAKTCKKRGAADRDADGEEEEGDDEMMLKSKKSKTKEKAENKKVAKNEEREVDADEDGEESLSAGMVKKEVVDEEI